MRRIARIIMVFGFLFVLPLNGFGGEKEEITIDVMSAPFGTGSYVLSSALEDISKNQHSWLRISHSESPGLVFNIKQMEKKPELRKTMIVSSTVGVNWLAQQGMKPFDQKHNGLKLLANYNLGSFWLASMDADITEISDLKGKRVALGRVTQIGWSIEPKMILDLGYGLGEEIRLEHVGTAQAASALTDGLVDAAIVGGYFDPINKKLTLSPQTVELMATGRKLYHISWGEDEVKRTAHKGIPIQPVTIPANTFEGLDSPLSSFTEPVAWAAHPEFPEELAYEFTKMVIENYKKFKEYHELGKLMSPEALPFGWSEDRIHPGALKAYKEAGIL